MYPIPYLNLCPEDPTRDIMGGSQDVPYTVFEFVSGGSHTGHHDVPHTVFELCPEDPTRDLMGGSQYVPSTIFEFKVIIMELRARTTMVHSV